MTPRVAGNLVALSMHTPDHRRPRIGGVVDLALPKIVSGDEEGGLRAVARQYVQDSIGVNIWSVVVG